MHDLIAGWDAQFERPGPEISIRPESSSGTALAVDVADVIAVLEQLQADETRQIDDLLSGVVGAAMVLGGDGEVFAVNDAAGAAFGLKPGQLVFDMALHADSCDELAAGLAEVTARAGESHELVMQLRPVGVHRVILVHLKAHPAVIDWELSRSLLERINREVNAAVALTSDVAEYGLEECWRFPVDGAGDCEDFALEKRRLLAAAGLPSAALTMAIVHHEVQFFPHAVLLAETTGGTWVLDNLADELMCWDALPYRYERRERPDGQWVRYVVR